LLKRQIQTKDSALGRMGLEARDRPPVVDVPDPEVALRVPGVEQGAAGAQHRRLDVAAVSAEGAEGRWRWRKGLRLRSSAIELLFVVIFVAAAAAALRHLFLRFYVCL
jgi:hypothetical protein